MRPSLNSSGDRGDVIDGSDELVDPGWSRQVSVRTRASDVVWHLLDTHARASAADLAQVRLTLLCVHGNPTSSFLFRGILAAAGPDIRVIAVDQLGMGGSERVGHRRLADRIDDLGHLVAALGLRGPIVTVAHDWGGPISLGWVLASDQNPELEVVGVVLMNSAVHQPEGSSAPWLIRAARMPLIRPLVTRTTSTFLRATLALSPQLPARVVRGYLDPYPTSASRAAIDAFVADIPLSERHPSWSTLAAIARGIESGLQDVPVLLLWGPGDPVFGDRYLHDLVRRVPHADVQRYPGARHLVLEDAPEAVADLMMWLHQRVLGDERVLAARPGTVPSVDLGRRIRERADATPADTALRDVGRGDSAARDHIVTWADLAQGVSTWATVLHERGVRAGHRVAILIPPGGTALEVVYACWQLGAVVVIVDRGLGLAGMRRTLRGVGIDHAVGIGPGLLLARSIGIPSRIPIRPLPVRPLRVRSGDTRAADVPGDAQAAIVFTSGSTGPAKGVRYTRQQVARTCATLVDCYNLSSTDVLVAAFAPWAILGPALGLGSVIPDMDLLRPSTLSATSLAQACARGDGSVLWASPAALRSVVSTAGQLRDDDRQALRRLRLVLAAGAPVPAALLSQVADLVPCARLGTPYGMTEVLPVTAVWLDEIAEAGDGPGVLVGRPVPGVEVAVDPLPASAGAHPAGEILVRAEHARDGYHHLWATQQRASMPPGWHRTGDVGTLDEAGRLWLGGRRAHVIWTDDGPVLPVPIEQRVEGLPWVQSAAAVGVGPVGTQQVVVIVLDEAAGRARVSPRVDLGRVREVRDAARVGVAAVLRRSSFPVDIRHQAKIDRTALARWAARVLAGH